MVFFYLTTISLEILFGATWWIVKKTTNGLYYLVYGNKNSKELRKLVLTDREIITNKELLDKLIESNKNQQIEIKKLNEKIELLSNYLESIK